MQSENTLSEDQREELDKLEQRVNKNLETISELCDSAITGTMNESKKMEQSHKTEKNSKERDSQQQMPKSSRGAFEAVVNSFTTIINRQDSQIRQIQETKNKNNSKCGAVPKQESGMYKKLNRWTNY